MGLMQSALETYDAMAGKYVGDYGQTEVLAPISHIVTRADIEIMLDLEGRFISASAVDKDAKKIIIPATEKSAGRSGKKPVPHPLCEQIKYLSGDDAGKRQAFIIQLKDWVETSKHPTLRAVLNYVQRGSLTSDLERADLIHCDESGIIKNGDDLIRWRVEGSPTPDCWKDKTLFDAFFHFYDAQHKTDEKALCMLDGKIARPAMQHPKGVVAANGNAKIISSNDHSGFTFRGRFTDEDQALTVSYEASQKAHAALRWLVANQGINCGGRMFICWNPQGKEIPRIDIPFMFQEAEAKKTISDYSKELGETLRGWRTKLLPEANVVIAAFDAATTGRLALTYYNELIASDLLDRLYDWDKKCCWWNGQFGVQSPALYNIAVCAFGSRRNENHIECDDKVLKQHMQRLIACRVEQAAMPQDIERALVTKCENLQLYEMGMREKLLSTTCAVIRKYRLDKREEWTLALEPERKDRSYQYGRLLAVLEKAEEDTYEKDEKRATNALRLLPMFVRRPAQTMRIVIEQLKKGYYSKLERRYPGRTVFYEKIIADIVAILSEYPEVERDRPLSETYLLGYYLQKKELYTAHSKQENEEEEQ